MATYADTTFEKEVRRLINLNGEAATKAMVDGAQHSFEAYREQVGFLRGLAKALEACDEARRLVVGEEPVSGVEARRRMLQKAGGVV